MVGEREKAPAPFSFSPATSTNESGLKTFWLLVFHIHFHFFHIGVKFQGHIFKDSKKV